MNRVLVQNASEICLPEPAGRGVLRHPGFSMLIENGRIVWLGPSSLAPPHAAGAEVYDAKGGAVLPALVDCHTHLCFAGDRLADFAERARGETYASIAARGGGIWTTVLATRSATQSELADTLAERLIRRERYGVGTTEVKSGYGLSVEHELKMLEAIAEVRARGHDLEATLLAAHAVPKDIPLAEYLESITEELIPEVARRKLARFVDVFVEKHAYSVDAARTIFGVAKKNGLLPRLHADQLSAGGGAELAAEVGAVSADHLEKSTDLGLRRLAEKRVVATLLPGALVFLGDSAPGLGARLRNSGVEVAVATDANPGSSPMSNLPLAATLAVTLLGLTIEEGLRAITLGAAHALGRTDIGTLVPGSLARFIVLDHPDSRMLIYSYGEPIIRDRVLLS